MEGLETSPFLQQVMMIDGIPATGPNNFTKKDMVDWKYLQRALGH